MIKVTSSFLTESRDRDTWRNRIHLQIGERGWHLSRVEAERLSAALTATLEATALKVYQGTLSQEGDSVFLVTADGTRHPVVDPNLGVLRLIGEAVQATGRGGDGDGDELYLIKAEASG